MDATAIQALIDAGVAAAANAELPSDSALIPSTYKLESTEHLLSAPVRFRRTFTTRRLGDFLAYVKAKADGMSAVFIDPDMGKVVAVLNHGDIANPAWGDNRAIVELRHEPEFAAFANATKGARSQREMIEFLEDWLPTPFVFAQDALGGAITPVTAISAVRRVTIAARAESTHQQDDLRASRSALEEIEARGADQALPANLLFYGRIYRDLPEYTVTARLGLRLESKEPQFTLRMVGWDAQEARIANDIEALVRTEVGTACPVYVGASSGNYSNSR